MTRNVKPLHAKKKKYNEVNFEWVSRMEHIFFFLVYLTDYGTILLISDFSFLPFTIMTIFFGYPVLFLQNCIGQYTRKGCLFLKEMLPIFSGLGYTMFLLSGFAFLDQVFNTSMLLYYFMVSVFNSSSPWMRCYRKFYDLFPNCFSKKDFDLCPTKAVSNEPCFPPGTRTLSTFIFKEHVAFGRLSGDDDLSNLFYYKKENTFEIQILRIIRLTLVSIPLLSAANLSMKALHLTLRVAMFISFSVLFTIFMQIITAPGASEGFIWWNKAFSFKNVLSLKTWVLYFHITIEKLKLAEGVHILFGSFIAKANPDPWRCMNLTLAYMILAIACSLCHNFFYEQINYKLNVELEIFQKSEENAIFITLATFLGIQASSYFFSVIVYLVLCTVSFMSLLIKLTILEKTITVELNIPQYSYYVRIGICFVAIILAVLISLMGGNDVVTKFKVTVQYFTPLVVGLLTITVWMYGMQKICDDIEYLLGTRTKGFVKIGWVLTPLFCAICYALDMRKNSKYDLFKGIFLVTISAIFIISFLCKVFLLIKRKNIMQLLKSTDDFGPPDIDERIQRILHNPSAEVKYRRRLDVCHHECLLDSHAIKAALNEEFEQIRNLIEELRVHKATQDLEEKIISHIENYQKYLLRMTQQSQSHIELHLKK